MKKILSIVGNRPQFIKASVVSRALASARVPEILVHTGQHYDFEMSDVFFKDLEIKKPEHHLGIGSGAHGAQTGRMLEAIEKILLQEKPHTVLVYGDTNSTLAGALAAAKLHIPVAHVEAGLRSFNRAMPEEINRVLTDHVSDILFAPTELAASNLSREGISPEKIHQVGDVMYDAALQFGDKAERLSTILKSLKLTPKQYILATVHRAENTDDPERLTTIMHGLSTAATETTMPLVLPLHPRTRKALESNNMLSEFQASLTLIPPVGYLDMLMLEKNARLIATDSGGVQKEAYFYRVPCVTLRTETEWQELIATGWNRLADLSASAHIAAAITAHLDTRGQDVELYGSGDASAQIAQIKFNVLT